MQDVRTIDVRGIEVSVVQLRSLLLDIYDTAKLPFPGNNFNPVHEVIKIVCTIRGEENLIDSLIEEANKIIN